MFSYYCAGYVRDLPIMPFYKHDRLKAYWIQVEYRLWSMNFEIYLISTEYFTLYIVMGDTRIFNSIPILWRLESVDTDTYFDTKIYSQIVLSIPEMITYFVGIDHQAYSKSIF